MTAAEQTPPAPEWRDVSAIRAKLAGRTSFSARLLTAWLDDSPAVGPPADLPATLATVDDVRRVCAAAGLTEPGDRDWIWSPDGDVGCRVEPDPIDRLYVHVVDRNWLQVATFALSTSALLWHAIKAARSTR